MDLLEITINMPGWLFATLSITGSLATRIAICFFAAVAKSDQTSPWEGDAPFLRTWWRYILGKEDDKQRANDSLQTLALGTIEVAAYSLLFIANEPEYVGAWLALKTLPQWSRWKEERWIYNRFLIGNALVIMFAYLLARWSISPLCAQPDVLTTSSFLWH